MLEVPLYDYQGWKSIKMKMTDLQKTLSNRQMSLRKMTFSFRLPLKAL
jgi:hypothetical protein